MNYAEIKPCDIANGPGVRVSLFVSGCRNRCKGCFNSEAWDFQYGREYTSSTTEDIISMMKPEYISGITLLGGDPFEPENQQTLATLIKEVRKTYPSKTIWAYTGYELEDSDLLLDANTVTGYIVNNIDVLVDGPFQIEKRNVSLRFRGSENQRIIDIKKSLAVGSIVLWEDEWGA